MANGEESEEITVTGPLVDLYCWDNLNGIALDSNGQTNLKDTPYLHTVHCLVEVGVCLNSGFAFVHKPNGATQYEIQYLLDDTGNELAEEAMLKVPKSDRYDKVGFEFTLTGIPDLSGSRPVLITDINDTQPVLNTVCCIYFSVFGLVTLNLNPNRFCDYNYNQTKEQDPDSKVSKIGLGFILLMSIACVLQM